MSNFSQTFTSDANLTIPAGISKVDYVLHGAKGGKGGPASTRVNTSGAPGAYGQKVTGSLEGPLIAGATIKLRMGDNGSDSNSRQGGNGGGGWGNGGSGGKGGNDSSDTSSSGWTAGGGGGGGGATAILSNNNIPLVIAGGGGGGACICYSTFGDPNGQTNTTISSNSIQNNGNGGQGGTSGASFNGGGGGAGGGRTQEAGGGASQAGNDISGGGGQGGEGYYKNSLHNSVPTVETSSTFDGFIKISWTYAPVSVDTYTISGQNSRTGNELFADAGATLNFSWSCGGSVAAVVFDGVAYAATDSVSSDKWTRNLQQKTLNFEVVGDGGDTITFDIIVNVAPVFTLTSNSGLFVDEGFTHSFNLLALGVPNNIVFDWSIVQAVTDAFDFTSTSGTVTVSGGGNGTVSVRNPTGTIDVGVVADNATEGQEAFILAVTEQGGTAILAQQTVTINDTSVDNPIYNIYSDKTILKEDDFLSAGKVNLYVEVANIPDTTYSWEVDHIQTSSSDFVSATSGTVSLLNGFGTFQLQTVEDYATEGDQVFNVVLKSGSTELARLSEDIVIKDTTLNPTYSVFVSDTSLTEVGYLTITAATQNVPNLTTLYWTINNISTSNSDFSSMTGSFQITNDSGVFNIIPIFDTTTENAKSFTVSVRSASTVGPVLVSSNNITLSDADVLNTAPTTSVVTYNRTKSTRIFIPSYTASITTELAGEGGSGAIAQSNTQGASIQNFPDGSPTTFLFQSAGGGDAGQGSVGGSGGFAVGGDNNTNGSSGSNSGLGGSGAGGSGSNGSTGSYPVYNSAWFFQGQSNTCTSCDCTTFAANAQKRACYTAPDPVNCAAPGWRCICDCWTLTTSTNNFNFTGGGGGSGAYSEKYYSRAELQNAGYLGTTQTLSVNEGGSSLNNGYGKVTFNYLIPTASISTNLTSLINGQTAILTWTTTDASSVELYINGVFSGTVGASSPPGGFAVQPTDTTTYTLIARGYVTPQTDVTAEVSIVVFQPPDLTFEVAPNPQVVNNISVLSWSSTGSVDLVTIDQNVGQQNITGQKNVTPITTTTYTATASGLGGTDTKSVTLTIWQIPQIFVTYPAEDAYEYGVNEEFTVTTDYANIEVKLRITYLFADGSQVVQNNLLTTNGSASVSSPLTQTVTPVIPWGPTGPTSLTVLASVTNDATTVTLGELSRNVDIDRLPEFINISPSLNQIPGTDPIFQPIPDLLVSNPLLIDDIDIPVEIKADSPIQVRFDDNDPNIESNWNNLRPID